MNKHDKYYIDQAIELAKKSLGEADGWNKDKDLGPYYTIGAYTYHIKRLIELLEGVRDEALASF
jgi:hypothetical protein